MRSIWSVHQLVCHRDTPSHSVQRVTGQVLGVRQGSIEVEFGVWPAAELLLPREGPHSRADGLWKTTCFEAFLKSPISDGYIEMNFSPSFDWAAYRFRRYRDGMQPLECRFDPEIWVSEEADHYFLSGEFDPPDTEGSLQLGLSAVIEEKDGTKSYWALAHPPGKPDFHHPDCFVLELPAAKPA